MEELANPYNFPTIIYDEITKKDHSIILDKREKYGYLIG